MVNGRRLCGRMKKRGVRKEEVVGEGRRGARIEKRDGSVRKRVGRKGC